MKSSLILLLFSVIAIKSIAQETQIKGFNDIQVGNLNPAGSPATHGFMVGQFDLFITSRINDHTSFLGETVFEWDPATNTWSLDLERAIVRYSFSDLANISAGKFHTPFGYWNNAYHHGSLIQPTIQRPNIVRFEDEGGFLPIHQVGAQLDGSGISDLHIGYNLLLSNGQSQGNSGGGYVYNSSMAVSWAVSMEPVDGFKVIASGHDNYIPAGSTTYQGVLLPEDSHYKMNNLSVAYFLGSLPFEICVEYYNIANSMATSGTTNLGGFFGYVGFTKFKIIPYVVYNNIRFQSAEKFFVKNDLDGFTGGLRYSVSAKAVLKLEFTRETTQLVGKQDLLRVQFAIGF